MLRLQGRPGYTGRRKSPRTSFSSSGCREIHRPSSPRASSWLEESEIRQTGASGTQTASVDWPAIILSRTNGDPCSPSANSDLRFSKTLIRWHDQHKSPCRSRRKRYRQCALLYFRIARDQGFKTGSDPFEGFRSRQHRQAWKGSDPVLKPLVVFHLFIKALKHVGHHRKSLGAATRRSRLGG